MDQNKDFIDKNKDKDKVNLKKALKSYLKIKENLKNEKISLFYANKTLEYIEKISDNKYEDILQETEEYCKNYILNTQEKNSKKPNYTEFLDFNKIFEYIDNGDLEKIKKSKINKKDLTKFNKDGLTPLHYCIKNGDVRILKELLYNEVSLNTIDNNGNTLLEYACLSNDPNVIKFLTSHGTNLKKNIFLRDNEIKLKLRLDNLDVACIVKLMIISSYKKKLDNRLEFLKEHLDFNKYCGLGEFTIEHLIIGIGESLKKKGDEYLITFIDIIKEELQYTIKDNIYCYKNKIELLIYNLVPFIDYQFNLTQENLYLNELRFIIKKFKKDKLYEKLYEDYIDKLVTEDFLGIQLKKIFNLNL